MSTVALLMALADGLDRELAALDVHRSFVDFAGVYTKIGDGPERELPTNWPSDDVKQYVTFQWTHTNPRGYSNDFVTGYSINTIAESLARYRRRVSSYIAAAEKELNHG